MNIQRLLGVAVLACAASLIPAVVLAQQAGEGQMSCAQVTTLKLPDVRITDVMPVPAATTGAIRAAHCRVNGVIGTETRFSLLLPDTWNRKLFMGGGGGFVGTVQNTAQTTVNLGYATVGTDTGHQGGTTDASWALNNIERRVNFGYLAVHRTVDVAKAIIASYYGSAPTRNYFTGCSRGGGQAMMEAIRYPDDFDGVIAGAPALDWTGIAAQFIKDTQAAFPDPNNLATPVLTAETMSLVGSKVLEACDALDGVKDGVMDDPRRCMVDIDTLGLPDAQRTALKKIYGATTIRDGVVYPAQPFGGETDRAGWQLWITGGSGLTPPKEPSLRFGFGVNLFKYIVFNDPNWDYAKYDFANFKKDTELTASFLNATNPDLSAYKAKGHKVIMWHGWADAGLSPLGTVKYYDEVKARDPKVDDFMRVFMMPGVLHCAGGPGPDNVDWVTTMVDWVEKGKAPDRVIASKMGPNAVVTRARPLCPYPQHAEYKGSGSTDEADSFVCR
jgi:feruloyl esterase